MNLRPFRRQGGAGETVASAITLALAGCGWNPLMVDAGPDRAIGHGDSARLEATVQGADKFEILWTPIDSLDAIESLSPRAFPDEDTTYTLTVTALDGRSASDTVTVTVSDADTPGIGTIEGEVTQRSDGSPVAGARVRIDLSPGPSASTVTDKAGRYSLSVPEVPEFFAMTVSKTGFVPASVNVARSSVEGDTPSLILPLEAERPETVVIEPAPDVHHLGDDTIEVSAGGQFQKVSEGLVYERGFELAPDQLAPHFTEATLTVLAKGTPEARHRIEINGTSVGALCCSADDGTFDEREIPLPIGLLVEGENTVTIRSEPNPDNPGDHDDFEFVNVQIHLFGSGE